MLKLLAFGRNFGISEISEVVANCQCQLNSIKLSSVITELEPFQ